MKYSESTRKFLNDLMKESGLTTLQRKCLESALRPGAGATPSTSPQLYHCKTGKPTRPADDTVKRYHSSKPRTLKDIVESGAYERENFRPSARQKNYTAEKERLQSIMEFGKETKLDPVAKRPPAAKKKPEECTEKELIDSVISEIEEREKFIAEMESFGQGSKHRASVLNTIRERITQLEAIYDKLKLTYRKNEVHDLANKYNKTPGWPKTEWF